MSPAPTDPLIQIRRISKNYSQKGRAVSALSELSLQVEAGDIYGIIGQSGAGKSTLIRCLAGLITPTSGEILFHGESIHAMSRDSLRRFRRGVGMIFQHFNLLSSRTVAGNVAYPLEIAGLAQAERQERVIEMLRLVGLETKADLPPSRLSGGEKQRVGIARALASRPELLLCDEATSALDPKTTKEILELLKSLHQRLGVTMILITHQMEVVRQICNKVAVMQQGSIVEQGPVVTLFAEPQHPTTKELLQNAAHEIPREFFKKSSATRKLLRLQFRGEAAEAPIISSLVRQFQVDANILLGFIDRLQTLSVGTLIIELTGSAEGIDHALQHLVDNKVHYEVLEDDS